jgi:hypothetical protein
MFQITLELLLGATLGGDSPGGSTTENLWL